MAKNKVSQEFIQWEPSCSMRTDRTHGGTDGPTDRHNEDNRQFFRNFASAPKNNKLLLNNEINTFCYEIRAKHINGLCDQNVQFLRVKLGGA
jgi:hypothetical protein